MSTSANMTITNDMPLAMDISVTSNSAMSDTFPNMSIAAFQSSPVTTISTSAWPSQSQFRLNYDNIDIDENMTVLLGQGAYRTGVQFDSALGKAGAVLAPTQPFSPGADYQFYFFGGPGVLPALVNSAIGANLPAVAAYVAAHPLTVKLGPTALTITGINLGNASCSYAAITPDGPQRWNLNAIMNVTGAVSGHLSSVDVSVTVTNAAILVQATLDESNPGQPSCTVTRLACSIGDFSISAILLTVLELMFPPLTTVISSPYHLAGALNTTFNGSIVSAINKAIADHMKPTLAFLAPMAAAGRGTGTPAAHPVGAPSGPATGMVTNYSTWMSVPEIQDKLLSELKLPGTHDSGTYQLNPVLSQITYDDIRWLWTLDPGTAPANGVSPFGDLSHKVYVGPALMQFVLDVVASVSQAQPKAVFQQLAGGIRYLDLRVYYDTRDGLYYLQHGLQGPKLTDVLDDVASFFNSNSGSGELVFLEISHTNFGDDSRRPAGAATLIQEYLGKHLYLPDGAAGRAKFDFQQLRRLTLGSITQGSPKVMVLNTDTGYVYSDTVVNTAGFAS
jgi:hypothetical protein